MSEWTNQATRETGNHRKSTATRALTCFEVLDYDSLTNVSVRGALAHVVALIYKRVTITHNQNREYLLSYTTDEDNARDTKIPTMPLWYLDAAHATDEFNWNGTRDIEYILSLVVNGSVQTTRALGTLYIGTAGHYNLSGTDKQLKEDDGVVDSVGPTITVAGNRLYGVSINCGEEAVTYSYDIEELTKDPSNNALFQTDAPPNVEDYNSFWTKKSRMVGAINYAGISDSKEFNYGTSGTRGFPDTVMAVGYQKVG